MRNLLFITFALLVIAFPAKSQLVSGGDIWGNASIGLFSGSSNSGSTSDHTVSYPAVYIGADYMAFPTGNVGLISIGGEIGIKYTTTTYEKDIWSENCVDEDNWNEDHMTFASSILGTSFILRAAWHLQGINSSNFNEDKWDLYAGLGLGSAGAKTTYSMTYEKNTCNNVNKSSSSSISVPLHAFAGVRMSMSETFALLAEFNSSVYSHMRVGISLKF